MAKSKKKGIAIHTHQDINSKKKKKMHSFSRLSTTISSSSSSQKTTNTKAVQEGGQPRKHQQQQQHMLPTVPFGRNDRILLIGEGDFSFARSLAEHHRCRYILATCYDSKDVLHSKYPQAEENINKFLSLDAFAGEGKSKSEKEGGPVEEEDEPAGKEEENPQPKSSEDVKKDDGDDHDDASNSKKLVREKSRNYRRKVLFSVDARKLGTAAGGGKEVRRGFPRPGDFRNRKEKKKKKERNPAAAGGGNSNDRGVTTTTGSNGEEGGPWDIICFNFPHVGGLSTDVNRQVRANQELLVAFFKACVPLLSTSVPTEADDDDDYDDNDDRYTDSDEGEKDPDRYNTESELSDSDTTEETTKEKSRTRTIPKTRGQILVTLFEGEPYTLWNIKDLARHAGLRVVTSFRFSWKSYPGYSHARTLGVVESRSGRTGGGWKGEDREARTYVFEVKGEDNYPLMGARKRTREDSSDDDD
ncbi:hypothetical protein VTN96DRAFT_8709 [Rasamsonia emersonii]